MARYSCIIHDNQIKLRMVTFKAHDAILQITRENLVCNELCQTYCTDHLNKSFPRNRCRRGCILSQVDV